MTQPQAQPQSYSAYDSGQGSFNRRRREGRFVWHDMMTTDVSKSRDFYSSLFGWNTRDIDMGEMGSYTMLRLGERDLGGLVPLDPKHGIPSHWVAYVTVKNVDELCARVLKLGGKVCVPGTDIPKIGRFAVIEDPSGAIISPFTYLDEAAMAPEDGSSPVTGDFCWDELLTSDTERAKTFYGDLFGWSIQEVEMGSLGLYTLFNRGTIAAGGMMKMPPEEKGRPAWLPYVAVTDVDAIVERIAELGGAIYVKPSDIPDIGRFAVAADTTHGMFALLKSIKA